LGFAPIWNCTCFRKSKRHFDNQFNTRRKEMKSLRISALMLALGAFAVSSIPAHAQQEVDPDHYDQTAAPAQPQQKAAQSQHKAVANKQHKSNVKLASQHSKKAQPQQASASGLATEESEAFGLGSTK
jgi:hypothetical protein